MHISLKNANARTKLGGTGVEFIREKSLQHRSEPLHTRKFAAYSPEFAGFFRGNRRALMKAVNIIRNNIPALENGERIVDRKARISIQKAATGLYKGRSWLNLKVKAGGKELFVKWHMGDLESMAKTLHSVENYLAEKNHKIMGFNMKIIRPHLLYTGSKKRVLVTDFYNRGEVRSNVVRLGKHFILLPFPNARKIEAAVSGLVSEMKSRGINIYVEEEKWKIPFSVNAFYQPRTRTILLYDIE